MFEASVGLLERRMSENMTVRKKAENCQARTRALIRPRALMFRAGSQGLGFIVDLVHVDLNSLRHVIPMSSMIPSPMYDVW